ncbi:hypothetical protein ABKN59_010203 [Abortiporus biennis]
MNRNMQNIGSPDWTVTFLGTCSGGGPIETRNCSSLVLDIEGDGLWMIDCAEGTSRQFASQPWPGPDARRLKMNRLSRIFVTHMHADHTMGLITLLRNILGIYRAEPKPQVVPTTEGPEKDTSSTLSKDIDEGGAKGDDEIAKIEIFGPRGLREFIRLNFKLTHTRTASKYVVHELLFDGETSDGRTWTSAEKGKGKARHISPTRGEYNREFVPLERDEDSTSSSSCAPSEMDVEILGQNKSTTHVNEILGYDIPCDNDGFWRGILEVPMRNKTSWSNIQGKIIVDAGGIVHRDPCIGYVFREQLNSEQDIAGTTSTPRTLVILGDTSDPSAIVPLVEEQHLDENSIPNPPAVSLLVHEATDCFIPYHIDSRNTTGGKNRNAENVQEKAKEKGHSTPAMAGKFAKMLGAERLILNHIGARFPAPLSHSSSPGHEKFRQRCMEEIERQAYEVWFPHDKRRYDIRQKDRRVMAAWDYLQVVVPPNVVIEDQGRVHDEADVSRQAWRSDSGVVAGPTVMGYVDPGMNEVVDAWGGRDEPGASRSDVGVDVDIDLDVMAHASVHVGRGMAGSRGHRGARGIHRGQGGPTFGRGNAPRVNHTDAYGRREASSYGPTRGGYDGRGRGMYPPPGRGRGGDYRSHFHANSRQQDNEGGPRSSSRSRGQYGQKRENSGGWAGSSQDKKARR